MSTSHIYEDGTYLNQNQTWHAEDSPWKAKNIGNILKKNAINPSTVCEIGCGAGEILNCLASNFSNEVLFSGYEISPQAFSICESKEKHNIRFFLKNLLDDSDASFDVVMAIDVFEHVEDCFLFLRKFREKGKYKIFHIPLDLSVQSVLRGTPIMERRESVGHIHYFTKEIALALLGDTGYEIVDYCYTSSSLELPNLSWKAKMMKLPRKLAYIIHQDMAVRVLGGYSLLVLAK